MKKLLPLVLALLSTCPVLAGDTGDDVVRADAELNALIAANDAKRAASYYHDDFVLTTSGGSRKSKADMLAEIGRAEALKLTVNETTQTKVRRQGATAVLTGVLHQKGTYQGTEFDVFLLVTDTWVRTDAGWKLLAGHASTIPAAKAAAMTP